MNSRATPLETLQSVERLLLPSLDAGVSLLAELPMNEKLFKKLDGEVSRHLKRYSRQALENAYDDLWRRVPLTMACYMAAAATFQYGGSYWHALPGTEDDAAIQRHLGEHFSKWLRIWRLETFEDAIRNESALRHITPILGHGLMPCSQLAPYFEHVIQPLSRNDTFRMMDKRRAHQEMIQISRKQQLKQPIRRFIRFGRDYAVDITTRIIDLFIDAKYRPEMVKECTDGRAKELGKTYQVPEWLTKAFADWFNERNRTDRSEPAGEGNKWKSPFLTIDPYAAGGCTVRLMLPRQVVSNPRGQWDWQIAVLSDDGGERIITEIPARVVWEGNSPILIERSWVVPEPSDLEIRLRCDGRVLQSRVIDALDRPWLFFDGNSLRQCDFRAGSLFLLLAPGAALVNTSSRETFSPPGERWSSYSVVRIEPGRLDTLILSRPGGAEVVYHPAPAILVGSTVLPHPVFRDDRDTPVYDALPALRLFMDSESRKSYSLRLMTPEGSLMFMLEDLEVQADEQGCRLDLNNLVANPSGGDYRITIRNRNRLGSDQVLAFRYLPGLTITFPKINDPAPSCEVKLPAGWKVEGSGVSEGAAGSFHLAMGKTVTSVHLMAAGVNWTYRLRPPVPFWEFSGDLEGIQTSVTPGDVPVWSLEGLASSPYPGLRLDLAPWLEAVKDPRVAMVMVDSKGAHRARTELNLRPIQRIYLPVTAWLELGLPQCTLKLVLESMGTVRASLDVAVIRQGWRPDNLRLATLSESTLEFAWTTSGPSRNRVLLLFPLTRPWDAPRQLAVPAEAVDRHTWDRAGLSCGYYALSTRLSDDWGELSEPMMLPDPASVTTFWLGSPVERLEHLETGSTEWTSRVEAQLFDHWAMLPTGPAPSTFPPLDPDDSHGILAAWHGWIRITKDSCWEDAYRALGILLGNLTAERLLHLASNVPESQSSDLEHRLLELGLGCWPVKRFTDCPRELQDSLRKKVSSIVNFLVPTQDVAVTTWHPWHEELVRRAVDGEWEDFNKLVDFCDPEDPLLVANVGLFRSWMRQPERSRMATDWVKSQRWRMNTNHFPETIRMSLNRFAVAGSTGSDLMALPFLILLAAAHQRMHAVNPEVDPQIRFFLEAYHHAPELAWLALGAWENHLTSAPLTVRGSGK